MLSIYFQNYFGYYAQLKTMQKFFCEAAQENIFGWSFAKCNLGFWQIRRPCAAQILMYIT